MTDRHVLLIVALVVICQNAIVTGLCLLGLVSGVSNELLFAIVNGAGTAQGFALSYFFGSSAGSAAKTDALKQMVKP